MLATIMRGMLDRTELRISENPNCWSIVKIKSLLDDIVGVFDYEIFNDERIVNVRSRGDIVRMLLYLVPCELSSECGLTISKIGNKVSMQIGSWQFETEV